MPRILTDTILRKLKPGPGRHVERDLQSPGLQLRVGARSLVWSYEYRSPETGKKRRVKLKPYKASSGGPVVLSLADARRLANEYAAMVARGHDPQDEGPAEAPNTFGDACNRWLAEVAVNNKSRRNQAFFLSYIPERIRDLPLRQVTRGHGKEVLEEAAKNRGQASANQIVATGSAVLNWCKDYEWIASKPWHDIKRFKIKPRKRSFTPDEIRRFWEVCEERGSNASRLLQLLLLTGQRRSEILTAGPHMIEDDWLMIPTTKNDLPHAVFLTKTAREIIRRADGTETAFFATGSGAPLKSPESAIKTVRRHLGPEFAHWQVKDLRNTFVNESLRAGIPRLLVSLCCNHSSPQVDDDLDRGAPVTDKSYASRGSYLDQMRWAWETWEKRLLGIVSGGGKLFVMNHHRARAAG